MWVIVFEVAFTPHAQQTNQTPTIPDKDLKDYFKAQLSINAAQQQMQAAQQQMKQVIGKLTDDCGTKASPIIDQTSQEPICQLKPIVPEPAKK